MLPTAVSGAGRGTRVAPSGMRRVARSFVAAIRTAVDVVVVFVGLCARWVGGRDPRS